MRSWIPRYLILPLRFVNFDNLVSLLVTVWPGAVGRVPQVPQWELGVDPARAADILRSFPKGNGVNHLIFQPEFPVFLSKWYLPLFPGCPGFKCAIPTRLYLLLGSRGCGLTTMHVLEITNWFS